MRSTESKAGMCMRSIHESVIGSEAKLQPYTVRLRASAVSRPHEALYDLGCQSTCNDLNAMRTEEFATVCRKDKPKRHFRRRSLYVLYVSPRGGTVCHPPCIMVTEWGAVKSGPSPEYTFPQTCTLRQAGGLNRVDRTRTRLWDVLQYGNQSGSPP